MLLKYKVTIGALILAALPILVSGVANTSIANMESRKALHTEGKNKLTAVRDLTKGRIEDYFQTIQKQVQIMSQNHMVVDAMRDFKSSFNSYNQELSLTGSELSEQKKQLADYYNNDFQNQYRQLNQNQNASVDEWISKLDEKSIALQYSLIKANPNPLGEKDGLAELPDNTTYAQNHRKYHPVFRNFLKEFEFYDIFLVDAQTGHIVYSVFKELDFATSLKNGSFNNTGIAEVFNKALKASGSDFFALSDFSAYPPSYEGAASFIASPIFEGAKLTGVLIFQMPLGQINNLMTHNGKWKSAGLGESGETYLVGGDFKLRSESRFLLEDSKGYLEALRSANISDQIVKTIEAKSTGIGLQPVETAGSSAALSGKTGFQIFEDYRNVPVLSAYAPIEISGVNWAIMAELDEAEAFASADKLSFDLMIWGAGVAVVMVLLAGGIGVWFAGSISKPITQLSTAIAEIEANSDLTRECRIHRDDELGTAANAFNAMIAKFRNSMQQVSDATSQLATTAEETSVISEQTNSAIQTQLTESTQVATAMTEMSATVQEVAESTLNTSQAAGEVNDQASDGQKAMQDTINQIEQLSTTIESAGQVIDELSQHSNDIGTVLDVIKGIAEQTNLLALNAAIEAARAGEQGRGFAVVADEVRNLASKTQASTEEINQMIDKLQSGSRQAVNAVNSSQQIAQTAVEQASITGNSLDQIIQSIQRVSDMSSQIASASEEQSAVAEEINRNVVSINEMTEQTAQGSKETSVAGNELAGLASNLQVLVGQFQVE